MSAFIILQDLNLPGENTSKQSALLHGDITKTLKSMTIPMILGMVMLMSFGLVDTFFVSLLGTTALAAISFTFPVTFTLISLNIGLGIGTSAIIARLLGRGEQHLAREYANGALMLSFFMVGGLAIVGWLTIDPVFRLIGANDTELGYIRDYMHIWYAAGICLAVPMVGNSVLRAAGDTATPSKIMAMGGLLNALLDPLLIFGAGPVPAMGIQGAALATWIAWTLCLAYILYLLLVKRRLMLPRLLTIQEFAQTSREILRIGLPAAGANMLTPLAAAVLTAVVAGYGSGAVATWGVGNRLESIASIVILSLSMTLPPFISQNFGAMQLARVRQAYRLSIRFVLAWQLMLYVLLALTGGWIAMLFTDDARVAQLIHLFLMIVPLGYGMQGVIILTNSSFNAMHKPMAALGLSVIRLFVMYVPVCYLGSVLMGLPGLFGGAVIANLLTAILAYQWFNRSLHVTENQSRG